MDNREWSPLALAYMKAALPRVTAPDRESWEGKVHDLRDEAERQSLLRDRPYVIAADVVVACRQLGYGTLTVKLGNTRGNKHRNT